MATSKEYRDFVLNQLKFVEQLQCRPMMCEYLLYSNGKLFGGIYDNRLLLKPTKNNGKFNLPKGIPYNGAKPMYFIEDIDNEQKLKNIIDFTCNDLL